MHVLPWTLDQSTDSSKVSLRVLCGPTDMPSQEATMHQKLRNDRNVKPGLQGLLIGVLIWCIKAENSLQRSVPVTILHLMHGPELLQESAKCPPRL